jgi:hypothetical protein
LQLAEMITPAILDITQLYDTFLRL